MPVPHETCRLCEGHALEVIACHLKGGVEGEVLRCQACGLVFLAAEFFDPARIAALYRGAYQYVPALDDLIGTPYDPYALKVERIADRLDPARTSVFEIGAGSGQFVRCLQGRVKRIVCQEFNPDQADHLRRAYGAEVHGGALEELDLAERFDVVAYLHVLEHVADPVDMLRRTMAYVKPGGILYIEVPNVRDPLLALYRVPGYDRMYFRQPHLFYYDQDTLRGMLEKAGFRHIAIHLAQNYSLSNHLHWADVATPQASLNVGFRFTFPATVDGSEALRRDLSRVFDDADARYRETLIRHGYADAVYAIVENQP